MSFFCWSCNWSNWRYAFAPVKRDKMDNPLCIDIRSENLELVKKIIFLKYEKVWDFITYSYCIIRFIMFAKNQSREAIRSKLEILLCIWLSYELFCYSFFWDFQFFYQTAIKSTIFYLGPFRILQGAITGQILAGSSALCVPYARKL